jgi:DNA invertase Pin-like site-specific DNA recombinase
MIQPKKQINNIYGYIRVSSEQQAKDGSSLEEQKRSIEEFVANKYGGRPVDQFFTDAGISGMKPLLERPGSRELTDVMDKHDVIVVTKLDRLARSFLEMVNMIPTLEESGITLYFCDMFADIPVVLPREKEKSGLEAKMDMTRMANQQLITNMAQFAEIEREMIMSRLRRQDCLRRKGLLDWWTNTFWLQKRVRQLRQQKKNQANTYPGRTSGPGAHLRLERQRPGRQEDSQADPKFTPWI